MMRTNPKRIIQISVGILLILLLLGIPAALLRNSNQSIQADLVSAAQANTQGFAQADGPRQFSFPADQGAHPDFQTEWWYYTGNLDTPDGRHFGYELTFFRRALLPPNQIQPRASDWGTDQVYMAHFAITNVAGNNFQAFERLSRGAADLAGAMAAPYHVWLYDWNVEEIQPNVTKLKASQNGLSIDLNLTDLKGPILEGDQGYSRKGPGPGNASYYYSLTRLASEGTIQVDNDRYTVKGLSWMDHEFSTSELAPNQVGWDWFSIQLNDGSELMVYQIRRKDGTIDPFSSGTLITRDGKTRSLSRQDFQIQVENTWRSPHSKATYPSHWKVTIPSAGLTLDISPYLADQELNVSYSYWEGAVRVTGSRSGSAVQGSGYVEMTGYSRSMSGEF